MVAAAPNGIHKGGENSMNEIITVQHRDIDTVTTEIITITRQAQRISISFAIEIGRRLVEVKSMVPYGEWGSYIEKELNYSQSTANNFMHLYEEYGDQQESLFGGNDIKALGDLSYTKVLRLLALPAEERVEFAQQNPVEEMSTRDLEKALKEYEAEKKALREQADQARADANLAKAQADTAQKARQELQSKVEELTAKAQKAKDAEKKAKEALKELEQNPNVPEEMMEKLRAEAEAEGAEKVRTEMQKQLEEAQAKLCAAEEKAEAERKSAQMGDPNVAVFASVFEQVQQDFNRLNGCLKKMEISSPDTAVKLRSAVMALLQKVGKEVAPNED